MTDFCEQIPSEDLLELRKCVVNDLNLLDAAAKQFGWPVELMHWTVVVYAMSATLEHLYKDNPEKIKHWLSSISQYVNDFLEHEGIDVQIQVVANVKWTDEEGKK